MSPTPQPEDSTTSLTPSLARIRKGTHFLWEASKHESFLNWWGETEYGKSHPVKGNPRWDSDKRRSSFWNCFNQCADAKTGEPNIICVTCQRLFVHPNVHGSDNSAPTRHLKVCLGSEVGAKRKGEPSVLDMVTKVSTGNAWFTRS